MLNRPGPFRAGKGAGMRGLEGEARTRESRTLLEGLRREMDRVRSRAVHLPESERALLAELLVEGRRLKDLAALMRMPAWELQRRLERLVTRVASEKFAFVAARAPGMVGVRRKVATA